MAAAISTNEQLASLQRDFAPHLELQPPTERVACSLRPRANPTNYSDRKAFDPTGVLSADEATGMAELEALEARGLELCSALYTYRSIARALPTAGGDDENKRAMYLTSFEVLHPHVQRVKELMYYKDDAVAKFCASLALCTGPGSDGLLLSLSLSRRGAAEDTPSRGIDLPDHRLAARAVSRVRRRRGPRLDQGHKGVPLQRPLRVQARLCALPRRRHQRRRDLQLEQRAAALPGGEGAAALGAQGGTPSPPPETRPPPSATATSPPVLPPSALLLQAAVHRLPGAEESSSRCGMRTLVLQPAL